MWAWAKTAAQDLIDEGITLNLACPGTHATDRMTELGISGRAGDPEDFGKVIAFLCSEPAGFVSGPSMLKIVRMPICLRASATYFIAS